MDTNFTESISRLQGWLDGDYVYPESDWLLDDVKVLMLAEDRVTQMLEEVLGQIHLSYDFLFAEDRNV